MEGREIRSVAAMTYPSRDRITEAVGMNAATSASNWLTARLNLLSGTPGVPELIEDASAAFGVSREDML